MRFEHNGKDPVFTLGLDTGRVLMHKNNTTIFSYTQQEQGNHIFVAHKDEGDSRVEGTLLWREEIVAKNSIEKYLQILQRLREIDVPEVEEMFMKEDDAEGFRETFGFDAAMTIPEQQLTPRQETHVGYLRFVLDKGILLPDDFRGSGALYI